MVQKENNVQTKAYCDILKANVTCKLSCNRYTLKNEGSLFPIIKLKGSKNSKEHLQLYFHLSLARHSTITVETALGPEFSALLANFAKQWTCHLFVVWLLVSLCSWPVALF